MRVARAGEKTFPRPTRAAETLHKAKRCTPRGQKAAGLGLPAPGGSSTLFSAQTPPPRARGSSPRKPAPKAPRLGFCPGLGKPARPGSSPRKPAKRARGLRPVFPPAKPAKPPEGCAPRGLCRRWVCPPEMAVPGWTPRIWVWLCPRVWGCTPRGGSNLCGRGARDRAALACAKSRFQTGVLTPAQIGMWFFEFV